uniref:Uncharacterized protein n=1 Tax=Ascaris lumbricoides TaxID=6252 RepID=A0A0M3HXB3_ASCLU
MATENVIEHAATTSNRPTYDNTGDADMLLRDDENESSPLLYGACSLPTVLLDDDRNTVTDVEESIVPCTSTLSDGGRLVARETKKRRRARRKRFVSDSMLKPIKKTSLAARGYHMRFDGVQVNNDKCDARLPNKMRHLLQY